MKKTNFLHLVSCLLICGYTYSQSINTAQSEGTISMDIPQKIDQLVQIKFSNNYDDTYKIQLFYGELDQAHTVLNKFNTKYTEWSGKVLFETPNFKVWVGNFRTRLEADRALMSIRKEFPSAFVFKPKK